MKQSIFLLAVLLAFSAMASEPQLSPNAPKDKPFIATQSDVAALNAAMAPYIAHARSTYPAAKAKFLAGLPQGELFFVTTKLYDLTGAFEQVFVEVSSIHNGQISGRIASRITTVTGFQNGEHYAFPETALLDWLITYPDGSEEGNYVGKFLDNYQGRGV